MNAARKAHLTLILAALALGSFMPLAAAGEATHLDGIVIEKDVRTAGVYDLEVYTAPALGGSLVNWTFDSWVSEHADDGGQLIDLKVRTDGVPIIDVEDSREDTIDMEIALVGLYSTLSRGSVTAPFALGPQPAADGRVLQAQLADDPQRTDLYVSHGPNLDEAAFWLNVSDPEAHVAFDLEFGSSVNVRVGTRVLQIGEGIVVDDLELELDPVDPALHTVVLDHVAGYDALEDGEELQLEIRVYLESLDTIEITIGLADPSSAEWWILDPVFSMWRASDLPRVDYRWVSPNDSILSHTKFERYTRILDGGALVIRYAVPAAVVFALHDKGGWEGIRLNTKLHQNPIFHHSYHTKLTAYVLKESEFQASRGKETTFFISIQKLYHPAQITRQSTVTVQAKPPNNNYGVNFELPRLAELSASDPSHQGSWMDGDNVVFYVYIESEHQSSGADDIRFQLHYHDISGEINAISFVRGDLEPEDTTSQAQVLFPESMPSVAQAASEHEEAGVPLTCASFDMVTAPLEVRIWIEKLVGDTWLRYGVTTPRDEAGGGVWTSNAGVNRETEWSTRAASSITIEANFPAGDYRVVCQVLFRDQNNKESTALDDAKFTVQGPPGGGLWGSQTNIGLVRTILAAGGLFLGLLALAWVAWGIDWAAGAVGLGITAIGAVVMVFGGSASSAALGTSGALLLLFGLPMLLIPDSDGGRPGSIMSALRWLLVGAVLAGITYQGELGIPHWFPIHGAAALVIRVVGYFTLGAGIVFLVLGRRGG